MDLANGAATASLGRNPSPTLLLAHVTPRQIEQDNHLLRQDAILAGGERDAAPPLLQRGQDPLCHEGLPGVQREEDCVGIAAPKYKAGQAMSRTPLKPEDLRDIRELAAA